MAFIQIIEVTTTRPAELQELAEEWSARTEGRRTAYRSTLTADRDRPNTYVQIAGFPLLPRNHDQLRPPGDR
jgi:hypothetical protein